jgi:hypothetical protein
MRTLTLCVLLAIICSPLLHAADELLSVTQDESAMERAISRYLQDHHWKGVREKEVAQGDAVVTISIPQDDGSSFDVVIDTEPSNKADDGTVLERMVGVSVYTRLSVPDGKRAAVLKAIRMERAVRVCLSSYIYIDGDGELCCQWCVNVMKEGLPTLYVAEAVTRVARTWLSFRSLAEKTIKREE